MDVESGLLFKLSKYKGKKHVLATLVAANLLTAYCARFTSQVAANRQSFDEEYETVVVAIKPEPKPIVFSFKDRVTYRLSRFLADPGSSVHEAYGIVKPYRFHNRDMYLPATLIIDKQGVLRWLYIGKRNSDRPSLDSIVEQLEILNAE